LISDEVSDKNKLAAFYDCVIFKNMKNQKF